MRTAHDHPRFLRRLRSAVRPSRLLAAIALAVSLSGCVAYPAYPSYGYGYGGYAYSPACCAVVGGYWGGGWGDHDWHGGGWHH